MRTQPDSKPDKGGSPAERRCEERKPATGEVTIRVGDRVINGDMVDVSPSGFRMRYFGDPLDVGSEVEITYPWGTVKARIMWFHVIAGMCDVGFYITDK